MCLLCLKIQMSTPLKFNAEMSDFLTIFLSDNSLLSHGQVLHEHCFTILSYCPSHTGAKIETSMHLLWNWWNWQTYCHPYLTKYGRIHLSFWQFKYIPSSLSHGIRKVKFLSKNSILTKLQHFHEIFHQNCFDNFSREIKAVNS